MSKQKIPLLRRRWFRLILILLYAVSAAVTAGGGFVTLYLYHARYYAADYETLCHELINDLCADDMFNLRNKFLSLREEGYFDETISEQLRTQLENGFMDGYHESQSNFFFTIYDMDDKPLLQSYAAEPQASRVQVYTDVTYEDVTFNISWDELEEFSYPENVENIMIEEFLIASDEERERYGYGEDASEAADFETPDVNALHDSKAGSDEQGVYVEGYDDENYYCKFRFDDEGTPYLEYTDRMPDPAEEPQTYAHVTYQIPHAEPGYYITGCVRADLTAHDHYYTVRSTVYRRYQLRYVIPAVTAAAAVCFLLCMILLLSQSGYAGDPEEPHGGIFERVPFDVFTAVLGVIMGSALGLAIHILEISDEHVINLGVISGGFFFCAVLVLWWMHSLAVRIRTGELFRNNLILKIVLGIWHGLSRLFRFLWDCVTALPGFWQLALVLAGILGVLLLSDVLLASVYQPLGIILQILLFAAGSILLIAVVYNLHILSKGGRTMSGGDFETKIPEKHLFGRFREHADCLNSLGDGMNKAISERLKSEMFRTELIANVSHDIRTPLTSIINYTDLLSKLDLKDTQALEYIDVLSRQSARLRKLTEDVLEASKATTGSIKTDKQTMDLRILIEQMVGEYTEQFDAKNLRIISDISEDPLYVFADGRLLWRVMDNLFANIRKYAMDGTRVYLNAMQQGDRIFLLLRNISANQLGISAEALMERFVQGDRSRNTEGSGLGLSIAQSLIALHDGALDLQIDGDLFKVTVTLPAAAPPEQTAE